MKTHAFASLSSLPLRGLASLTGLTSLLGVFPLGCSEGGDDDLKDDINIDGIEDPLGNGDDLELDDPSFDGGRRDVSPEMVDALQSASCTGWSAEGESLPVVLQLVVDVSRSMTLSAPGSMGSKWDTTRNALEEAIEGMPPGVSVGLLLYPNMSSNGGTSPADVNTCVNTAGLVPIAPLGNDGSDQRNAIQTSLRGALVDSYTPTFDAYTYALENSLIPYETSAEKFMLLITDGAPTFDEGCVNVAAERGDMNNVADAPTAPIVDAIDRAQRREDVRTFLIGSPGSEMSAESNTDMRPWLSESAVRGGTAPDDCDESGPNFCHLDMTDEPDFAAALSQGLMSIAGQIIDSCTFQTPQPPDGEVLDPNETNLIIVWGDGSASQILPDANGECSDGWQFNADGDVELCEETCDEIKMDRGARVELTFGCDAEETDVIFR